MTCKGKFGREQKQDERLNNCWGQVPMLEGKDQQPGQPFPHTYFLVYQGLLYQHMECQGQEIDLLVVPCSKGDVIIHLAQSNHKGPIW